MVANSKLNSLPASGKATAHLGSSANPFAQPTAGSKQPQGKAPLWGNANATASKAPSLFGKQQSVAATSSSVLNNRTQSKDCHLVPCVKSPLKYCNGDGSTGFPSPEPMDVCDPYEVQLVAVSTPKKAMVTFGPDQVFLISPYSSQECSAMPTTMPAKPLVCAEEHMSSAATRATTSSPQIAPPQQLVQKQQQLIQCNQHQERLSVPMLSSPAPCQNTSTHPTERTPQWCELSLENKIAVLQNKQPAGAGFYTKAPTGLGMSFAHRSARRPTASSTLTSPGNFNIGRWQYKPLL